MDRKDEQRLPSYFFRITKERAMDSNRIKDIDARYGTQDENGNGARGAGKGGARLGWGQQRE